MKFFLLGNYVTCKSCRKRNTLMGKSKRLTMVKCLSCNSEYAVQPIQSGFQAQVSKRSANVKWFSFWYTVFLFVYNSRLFFNKNKNKNKMNMNVSIHDRYVGEILLRQSTSDFTHYYRCILWNRNGLTKKLPLMLHKHAVKWVTRNSRKRQKKDIVKQKRKICISGKK